MKKVIVITGASSGIGKKLKSLYEADGNVVVNLSRTQGESENDIMCDVSDEQSVVAAFKIIKKMYGKIDVLINNAGYGVCGAMELVSTQEFEGMLDVNVKGVYLCSKYALPLMGENTKILNIASVQSIWALPYRGVYSLSKAAVLSLSLTQRMELHGSKIKVVAICPGDVKTNFSKNRVKNHSTNFRYGNKIENTISSIANHEHTRMDPEMVAKKIKKISEAKNPKPVKIIGNKYKFFHFIFRFLPIRFQVYLINKLYG